MDARCAALRTEEERTLRNGVTPDLMSDEEDGESNGVAAWLVKPPAFRSLQLTALHVELKARLEADPKYKAANRNPRIRTEGAQSSRPSSRTYDPSHAPSHLTPELHLPPSKPSESDYNNKQSYIQNIILTQTGRTKPVVPGVEPRTHCFEEPNFMVFFSMLVSLFSLFCFRCREERPIVTSKKTGTMATVTQSCTSCGEDAYIWRSKPFVFGKFPAENNLLSFGILMPGISLSTLLLFKNSNAMELEGAKRSFAFLTDYVSEIENAMLNTPKNHIKEAREKYANLIPAPLSSQFPDKRPICEAIQLYEARNQAPTELYPPAFKSSERGIDYGEIIRRVMQLMPKPPSVKAAALDFEKGI
ncbi:Hypp8325 [Branchiostoma lanceolatum]|uniref:Hypp8325 protein n=1 Tax=Branchiostoma lanceolatum TaxID=7740 RepID=A0A8K0EEG8_BRALA|nr:Hypp8325 [Branchiostoma lanceolatum]